MNRQIKLLIITAAIIVIFLISSCGSPLPVADYEDMYGGNIAGLHSELSIKKGLILH